jgi:hypothetical protein
MAELKSVDGHLEIDGKRVLAGWESYSGWYWFGIEKSEERKVGSEGGGSIMDDGREVDDVIWFGYIQGLEEEWGYFSEAEINSLGRYRVWKLKPGVLSYSGRRSRG